MVRSFKNILLPRRLPCLPVHYVVHFFFTVVRQHRLSWEIEAHAGCFQPDCNLQMSGGREKAARRGHTAAVSWVHPVQGDPLGLCGDLVQRVHDRPEGFLKVLHHDLEVKVLLVLFPNPVALLYGLPQVLVLEDRADGGQEVGCLLTRQAPRKWIVAHS